MNNQLLEKIIQVNGDTCPELLFKNPLLDRNVAKALSKSFVKILNISKENSNINNNLRLSILENIRNLCTIEPEGHLPIDENITESLTVLYTKHLKTQSVMSTDKELDAFLIRKFKSLHIESHYEPTTNPEIIQALINLNNDGVYIMELLKKEIIHLNSFNLNFIEKLCNAGNIQGVNLLYDDIAIKNKTDIEKTLLSISHSVLSNKDNDIENLFANNESLKELVKKSALSSEYFQISCSVLNFLFVMTNFDSKLQIFIQAFVKEVKQNCPQYTFASLYPSEINNVVVLLDFNVNELPEPIRTNYITPTIKYLKGVRERSEYDFIMLLSHFPEWFDIYFPNESM